MRVFIYILFSLFALTSCQKFIWNNPYDTATPKSIFTPDGLAVRQEGENLLLSWSQDNSNISGFKLFRSIDREVSTELVSLNKSTLSYTDANIQGGKTYTYTLKAYADKNESNEVSTEIVAKSRPTINTIATSAITENTATSGGTIVSDGGSPITSKGLVWSTSVNPTIDLITKTNDGSGNSAFERILTNLSPNTIYYVRAYATNGVGTAYGNDYFFNTKVGLNPTSITIGAQIWTNKNADVVTYRNGDLIPQVTDPIQWVNLTTGAWCWYNNDSVKYAATYGKLYNWYAVNDPRGLAPIGWHVPTNSDWKKLVKYLDSSSDTTCNNCTLSSIVGGFLKEVGVLNWDVPNLGATNSTGFTAVPGGDRSYISINNFQAIRGYGGYWSSTESDNTNSSVVALYSNNTNFTIGPLNKRYGWSVRFIKD